MPDAGGGGDGAGDADRDEEAQWLAAPRGAQLRSVAVRPPGDSADVAHGDREGGAGEEDHQGDGYVGPAAGARGHRSEREDQEDRSRGTSVQHRRDEGADRGDGGTAQHQCPR